MCEVWISGEATDEFDETRSQARVVEFVSGEKNLGLRDIEAKKRFNPWQSTSGCTSTAIARAAGQTNAPFATLAQSLLRRKLLRYRL